MTMKVSHHLKGGTTLQLSCLVILVIVSGACATHIKASTFGWNDTDATTAFKNAINSSYDTIVIDKQASDWIITPALFWDVTNKIILFENGVVLQAKAGSFSGTSDCLLRFNGALNLKLVGYGATLKMRKADYTQPPYAAGEWRSTLSLNSCTNVQVFGFKIMDSGGDGVYIGFHPNYNPQNYCENILLKDLWCDNHHRQGISVISAQHLRVEHCWFTNTIGTLPEFGIDLEPDDSTELLVDIVFDKCRLTGNNGSAIGIAVLNLNNTSLPLDVTFSNCYLSDNHTTANAYVACEIILGDNGKANAVTGAVSFNNCMIENSQWTAVYVRKIAYGYQANFNSCVFKDVSQNTANTYNNPIWVEVTDYYNACPRFGGAVFNNCLLSYGTAYNFLDSYGEDATSAGMGNVQFNNFTVINPNNVSYNVTRGGGSPASDCIFDFNKFTSAPTTTVSYAAGGNLIECNTTNSLLNIYRAAGSNVTYPLGISYSIAGSGIQGIDYSRMSGFIIIPQGSYSQTDTFFVLTDSVAESIKHDTVTINTSAYYGTTSLPQSVTIEDCGSTGVNATSNSEDAPLQRLIIESPPFNGRVSIRLVGRMKSASTIQVYDCLGRRVVDLTEQFRNNKAVWDASGQASGVYIVKLKNLGVEFRQKIVLVR